MILLPTRPNVEAAEEELVKWRKKVMEDYGITLDLDANETKALAKVTAAVSKMQVGVNALSGAIDFGQDILGSYPELFGEIDGEITKTVDTLQKGAEQAASWAVTGASLGAMFGPIGAAIGAATGAIAGAAKATYDWWRETSGVTEEQERITKELEKQKKAQDDAFDAAVKRWEQIKKNPLTEGSDFLISPSARKAAEEFQEALKGGFFGAKDLNDELDKMPPKVDRAKESFEDWLTSTYDKARAARDELAALNDAVIADMQGTVDAAAKQEAEQAKVDAAYLKSQEKLAADRAKIFADLQSTLAKIEEDGVAERQALLDAQHQELVGSYTNTLSNIAGVFGEIGSLLEDNIANNKRLLQGLGAAAGQAVSSVLKAQAREWLAKSIGQAAEGLAWLASPIPTARSIAATHFASSAKFAAAAAVAGVAGAGIGGAASRAESGGGSGGGEGGGGGSSVSTGARTGTTSDPGPIIQYTTVIYRGGGPGSTNIYSGEGEEGKVQAGAMLDGWIQSSKDVPLLKTRR